MHSRRAIVMIAIQKPRKNSIQRSGDHKHHHLHARSQPIRYQPRMTPVGCSRRESKPSSLAQSQALAM